MTWTYNLDFTTQRDQVRLLVGDTDTDDQQLQDEEIAFLVSQGGSTLSVAANACEVIAAKYAREVNKSVGTLSISAQERMAHYKELANTLRVRPAYTSISVFAGGVNESDKITNQTDSDLTKPFFTRETGRVLPTSNLVENND